MTTIIPSHRLRSARPQSWGRRAGFTLVEVLIGSTMSVFILAGVLSAFGFLARSGVLIQHYNDMESQARQALELFAEDVRQASSITWTDANTLTLTVNTALVTFGYSTTQKTFYRSYRPTATAPATTKILVTDVTTFQFKAFTITGTEITDFSTSATRATAGRSTKQLQISLEAARYMDTALGTERRSQIGASNTVLSARFILRNKIVTA